jgi:site-specific recombinase XerD
LAESSRKAVRHRLDVVAGLLQPGTDASTVDWTTVAYAEVAAVKAAVGQQYKWTTANLFLSALKGVLRSTWQLGLITTDQYSRATAMPQFRGAVIPAGRCLSDEEFQAFFKALAADKSNRGIRDLALFSVARSSGARSHELVGIDIADLDLNGLTVVLNGKGRRQRESALAPWCRSPLRAWLAVRGTMEGPLFTILRRNGKPANPPQPITMGGMRLILWSRIQEHGLQHFGWHDLRRSLVTNLLDSGADLEAVMKQVGHKDPKTTLRYSRREARKLQQIARSIESPFGGEAQ